MKEEQMEAELMALRLAFEYLVAPIIASYPHRDLLLEHVRRYRAQVVASRDPASMALSELLTRTDAAVRLLPEGFPLTLIAPENPRE